MTDETWRADVERILAWTRADQRFLQRVGARLGPDERTALAAVVETRGDPAALAQRLSPLLLAKLRIRQAALPPRVRQPADAALKVLENALTEGWKPPDAQQLAESFTERYAASLESLTGAASAAAAKAKALSGALKSLSESKELLGAVEALREQAGELQAAATACTHPEDDRTAWLERARELLREAADTIETLKSLRSRATELAKRSEQIAAALREWIEAPAKERAARAEAMATRVRAAADAAMGMYEQFAATLLGRAAS